MHHARLLAKLFAFLLQSLGFANRIHHTIPVRINRWERDGSRCCQKARQLIFCLTALCITYRKLRFRRLSGRSTSSASATLRNFSRSCRRKRKPRRRHGKKRRSRTRPRTERRFTEWHSEWRSSLFFRYTPQRCQAALKVNGGHLRLLSNCAHVIP